MGISEYYQELKAKCDIKTIARELGIQINRQNKAKCFNGHDNKTDSLTFYDDHAHCYGCGFHGDVITLIEKVRGGDHREARNWLADQVGMPHLTTLNYSPEQVQKYEEQRIEKKLIQDILTEAANYYHQILLQDNEMYKHLQDHYGFSEETISELKLGYSVGNGLGKHLISKGYSVDDVLKTGLFIKSKEKHIEFFNHRLTFPYWKPGRVVYMIGRKTSRTPDIEYEQAKYKKLLTRDEKRPYISEFIKNDTFYNEDGIKGVEEALNIEGVTDVISAMQAGFTNSISPVTVRFRREDFPKLKRLLANITTVYLINDDEENQSGLKGALETAEFLEGLGKRAYLVILPRPEGKNKIDLNEYLRDHPKEDLQKLMDEALTPLQFEIAQIASQGLADIKLADALKPIVMKLAALDKATAEGYLNYIKQTLAVKADFIKALRQNIQAIQKDQKGSEEVKGMEPTQIAIFDNLIDIVEHEGQPAFLISEHEELKVVTQIERDGIIYVPPDRKKMPWLLPKVDEVLKYYNNDSDSALFDGLLAYHKQKSELPDEQYYILIVAWDFHTYLLHKFEYSPYIWFYAIVERGKSRTGKGMVYVAYRGMHVESLRDAYLIRVTNDLGVTLFIDAINLWKKAESNGTEDVILLRYEKGATVPRVLHPDKGPFKDTTYFKVFGPTVIATNESVHPALDTRAIQITMQAAKKQSFEEDVRPEDGQPFRERLVAFRARHLNEELPQVKKPASGRLGDILKPLYQIIKMIKPEKEGEFFELVQKIEEGRRADKADSSEGRIVQTLLSLEEKVEGGLLAIDDITKEFNQGLPERWHWTNKKVGRKLKAMGFQKVKCNKMYIEYDTTLISNLGVQFGITPITPIIPKINIDKEISTGVLDDVTGVSPITPSETPTRKASNDGQTGIKGVSGVSPEGVQEEKNTHFKNGEIF